MRKENVKIITKQRESNFELYRVVIMLLIIAHHYVVNSGFTLSDSPVYQDLMSWRSMFLMIFGAWGKTGINCFVLITGYFMCQSKISLKKFVKLLLQILSINVIAYVVLLMCGYESVSPLRLLFVVWPVGSIGTDFTSCYLMLYLAIPFINILIQNLDEKKHLLLITLCVFIYTILGTVPKINVTFNYVSWFIVLYLIAAYFRIYPRKLFENKKLWGWLTIISVLLSALSVVVCSWLWLRYGVFGSFFLLADSNKLLALTNSVCSFLFFKNLKIGYSKVINVLGASTFGVFLIHANSDAMRTWLWTDLLHNVEMYDSALLIPHAILSTIGVFAVCAVLDYVRLLLIEKPFFKVWDTHSEKLSKKLCKIEKKMDDFLGEN